MRSLGVTNDTRICYRCKQSKPLTEFHKNVTKSGGLAINCKDCKRTEDALSYQIRKTKMNLNAAKFSSIFNGLSNIVKKTYEAVPIKNAWDANQIHSELIRMSIASDLKTTLGCLNTLLSSGLITEPARGTFVRIEVKTKTETKTNHPTVEPEVKPETVLDILFAIAARSKAISTLAANLAKDIEETALVVTETIEAESEDTKKLRQLQQILKSLG